MLTGAPFVVVGGAGFVVVGAAAVVVIGRAGFVLTAAGFVVVTAVTAAVRDGNLRLMTPFKAMVLVHGVLKRMQYTSVAELVPSYVRLVHLG